MRLKPSRSAVLTRGSASGSTALPQRWAIGPGWEQRFWSTAKKAIAMANEINRTMVLQRHSSNCSASFSYRPYEGMYVTGLSPVKAGLNRSIRANPSISRATGSPRK